MSTALFWIDAALRVLRGSFLTVVVVLGAVCLLDWLVRTRKVNPFGAMARFFRKAVDPFMAPVERVVVNAGGLPASAPWWLLAFVALAGIILISVLDFIRGELGFVVVAFQHGARGVWRLAVSWVVEFLQLAIIVRVILSWVHARPFRWYVRWTFRVTEPLLRPLRAIIPPFAMFDLTPLIALLLLWFVESLLLSLW